MSQQKYISSILSRVCLTDSHTATTPIELHHWHSTLNGELPYPTRYREIVGVLVYLTISRSDIIYAVRVLSRFVSAPHSTYYAALLCVLCYLCGTITHSLFFSASSSLELRAYSDADWAGDSTDRQFTTSFCVFLGDSLVS